MRCIPTLFCLALAGALALNGLPSLVADEPGDLTEGEIRTLTRDGDRLADQGDYLEALKKYNEAYMGVVARIRGQSFRKSVTPSMFNREELGKEMLKQMEKEYTEEELQMIDASYHALGLMSPEKDAGSIMTKLLTEEVAGFYDPDNKRMVLIVEDGPKEKPNWLGRLLGARQAFDKDEQKTTLAHELTHALQDQLYDLNALEEGIEEDDDMLIAFSALVEGDATLLMFVESNDQPLEQMDAEAMRATFNMVSWMMPLAGGEVFRDAPPIFRDSLTFPYFQGMLFTLAVAGEDLKSGKGGWPAIHAAYKSPPVSTEQIMHPRKYLSKKDLDLPQKVTVPQLQFAEQQWTSLGGNCLGELQTSILLKAAPKASQAAEGWDGDYYEVYKNDNAGLGLVYVSVWDSEQDAKEFVEAYKAFREKDPQKTQGVFSEGAKRRIKQVKDKVYILEGFSGAESKTLLKQVRRETTFAEKVFPVADAATGDKQ